MTAPRTWTVPDLPRALRDLLGQVPPSRVTTYGDLAEALGDIAAARWVGEFLRNHDHGNDCPCHRVVRRTGDVGLFIDRSSDAKTRLLRAEGVPVDDGRVDLRRFGFAEFQCDKPLTALAKRQRELPDRVRLVPLDGEPAIVAGVDVSYAGTVAVAAYAAVDVDGELIASHTVRQPVRFPYISGYLSYRELPALSALLESLPRNAPQADVTFVDGNGILHPRGAGIATHFGVLTGRRTIGVGKKLLCGCVDLDGLDAPDSRPVTFEGRIIGAAVKSGDKSRPIFVSPGHRMTVDDSVRLTQRLFHGHRLPEPLFHADRLSREAARE
ncbi:MAG: endonuclease V [Planctomycetaceae bacterium]